jgi:hypothetical protein
MEGIMRRCPRLLAGAAVVLAFVAASAVHSHVRGHRLARSRLIDEKHFDRIQVGMRLEEVEAVLGGPPGRFDEGRGTLHEPTRVSGTLPEHWGRLQCWYGDQGLLEVYFTGQDTVAAARYWPRTPAPLDEQLRHAFERLRRWRPLPRYSLPAPSRLTSSSPGRPNE